MPATLNTPVLTVDVGLIHKVDTRNVENLFSMWTVFSRCAGSLEEGRRLENLSWRLWNRETFCCVPEAPAKSTPTTSTPVRSSAAEIPDLSSSPGSVVDEEALDFDVDQTSASTSTPLEIARPQIRRQDSASSRSRGRERHITPDDLEKMVSTIKEKKDLEPLPSSLCPLPPLAEKLQAQAPKSLPQTPSPEPTAATSIPPTSEPASDSISGTSERSTTSVVKGFSPAHVSSSYRSIPLASAPSSIPTADIAAAESPRPTRRTGGFTLPGSSTDESSVERVQPLRKKNAVFTFGGSSNEEDGSLPSRTPLRSALTESIQRPPAKQTSFREEVATRTIQEEQPFDDDVFETDEDDIDESAIDDDDDSSDWEDSNEESGHASIDDKSFFQRVDSRPNLTSRRSLITTMLHQNDRASALANAASKSTSALRRSPRASPNGPSLAASVESDDGGALMMKSGLKPISENPRSGDARTPAQPITTPARPTPHQLALSPRTTRRNMLATELTVSLRQNLLWERQQKSQTANAVLKRRHTAHDMADLKQYPEKVYMDKDDQDTNASWNQYFGPGLGEYHSKGW